MLLGAALVCLGILATALADRIRQLRITRTASASPTPREAARPSRKTPPQGNLAEDDVVTALVHAGYSKALATRAALACPAHEQISPEVWMAAALRRCAQGGVS